MEVPQPKLLPLGTAGPGGALPSLAAPPPAIHGLRAALCLFFLSTVHEHSGCAGVKSAVFPEGTGLDIETKTQ